MRSFNPHGDLLSFFPSEKTIEQIKKTRCWVPTVTLCRGSEVVHVVAPLGCAPAPVPEVSVLALGMVGQGVVTNPV